MAESRLSSGWVLREAEAEITTSSSGGGLILGNIVYSGEGDPSTSLRA